jgi:molybdenum cofactor cytidylyltransferase
MGEPKLMMPWQGGGRIIDAVLAAWHASQVDEVIVTVHPDDRELQQVCLQHEVSVVVPDEPPEDMKRSVLFGLNFVARCFQPQPVDALLLAPADMPSITSTLIDQLLAQHNPAQPRLLAPEVEGRRGHPLLVPWPASAEISRLDSEQGINALWDLLPSALVSSDQSGALLDIDTPEDYDQHRPGSG